MITTGQTIHFTDAEQAAIDRCDVEIRRGATVRDAATTALAMMLPSYRSSDFVTHISQGTLRLIVDTGRIVTTHRAAPKPILTPDSVGGGASAREGK